MSTEKARGRTARRAVAALSKRFVITQIWKASRFRSVSNAVGKYPREEQRMVSNVGSQIKTRAFVRGFQCRDHFEEIIKRELMSRNRAAGPVLP